MKQLMTYGAIVLALVTTMLIAPTPPDVRAGGCRTSYGCYQPTYYPQKEYIYVDREIPVAYPVPFTVAVPVVSYLWNGGYGIPGYSPVFQAQPATGMGQVAVPQQMPANGNGNGNGNGAAQSTGAPRTSALLQLTDAELDYLIGRIEQRLAARAGGNNGGNNGGAKTAPPPVPQDNTQPKAGNYSDADVVRVLSTKLGATQKSCMDCHAGSSAKGGMKIFDSPGVLNQKANWAKIWDAADAGRMPKEAQSNKNALVSDADCEILRWKMMNSNGNSH